jgi:Lon protease-like protein
MDLALFPLRTVLFPGMKMPLHIFEERYKLMIRECIEESASFGVVLIRSGEEVGEGAVPHNVGTTAKITDIENLDEGRMNLLTLGVERFRIIAVTTTSPYLRGEVEIIEQRREVVSPETLERAEDLFATYLKLYMEIGNQWTRGVELPIESRNAADYIAARLELPPATKQQLLEELSPSAQLDREIALISEALPEMRGRLEAEQRQRTSGFAVLN